MDASLGKYLRTKASNEGTLKTVECGVEYTLEPPKKEGGDLYTLTLWSGRSNKPVYYCLVRGEARATELVNKSVEAAKASKRLKEEHKAERALRLLEMRKAIKVGTILVYSWGYEQTNIEFFEVVSKTKSGASVTLRRIGSEIVEETGPMSAKVKPVPGSYLENYEPLKKKITAYGVSFDHGTARPTTEDAGHYASWYY